MKIKGKRYKTFYDKFLADLTLNSKDVVRDTEKEVAALLRKLKLPRKASILDVLCKSGRHSRILAKNCVCLS